MIDIRRARVLLKISMVICSSGLPYTKMVSAFEQINIGDEVYVACERIAAYSRPSVYSRAFKDLRFGSSFTVTGLKHMFALPSTDFSSREHLEKLEMDDAKREGRRPKAIPEEKFMRAAWLQFDEGYVPASCAASESLFKTQTEREVAKRVESLNLNGTNKNFSEDESGDMTAMRGAAGRTKGGEADYEMIDAFIRSNQGITSTQMLEEFRREGMLGEYK
mgnify:CR=1 FL=1